MTRRTGIQATPAVVSLTAVALLGVGVVAAAYAWTSSLALGEAGEPDDVATAEESLAPPIELRRRDARPSPTPTPAADGHAGAGSSEEADLRLPYRVEVRTSDAGTADFARMVHEVLADPRGWVRAGFAFEHDPQAPYRIVIAEGAEVDRLCHPYDTGGRFSCQNGPVVAINADRWRRATPQWEAGVHAYRVMLINHEVGHLLHLHHPDPQCPEPGLPAPVMAQQSGGASPCRPNPWPLQWEVDLAGQRREPLAPGADHDPFDHQPAPPPARE